MAPPPTQRGGISPLWTPPWRTLVQRAPSARPPQTSCPQGTTGHLGPCHGTQAPPGDSGKTPGWPETWEEKKERGIRVQSVFTLSSTFLGEPSLLSPKCDMTPPRGPLQLPCGWNALPPLLCLCSACKSSAPKRPLSQTPAHGEAELFLKDRTASSAPVGENPLGTSLLAGSAPAP